MQFSNWCDFQKFCDDEIDDDSVQRAIVVLKQQHKVISKKVLQNILDQRNSCNQEFDHISDTEKMLQTSLLECKKARSYLSCARKSLTTTSLQILATYKKREVLQGLLGTLHKLKKMKSTELQLQQLLQNGDYSGAIAILLECKKLAAENGEYKCVEALSQKLQDTLLLTELQLDNVLNEVRVGRCNPQLFLNWPPPPSTFRWLKALMWKSIRNSKMPIDCWADRSLRWTNCIWISYRPFTPPHSPCCVSIPIKMPRTNKKCCSNKCVRWVSWHSGASRWDDDRTGFLSEYLRG